MDMASSASMGSPTTNMAMTSSAGMAMSTTEPMGGMDMGAGACKISMLWNWNTVDSCFISSSWHINSNGMFAGSCIGVILLVMALELLRRGQREYQHFIFSKSKSTTGERTGRSAATWGSSSAEQSPDSKSATAQKSSAATGIQSVLRAKITRPTLVQQMIRATIHMMQFAVAYFVMLMAMYYNGYIIICIFIGAWIGSFLFSWDQLTARASDDGTEITGCCG